MRGEKEEEDAAITKGQEETFRGYVYVSYLDYVDGFTSEYVCHNSSDCAF